jgi:drug/metabolite transporter (DMT)-like permease
MTSRKKVWIGLVVAVSLDTAAQIAWKGAAVRIPAGDPLWQIVRSLATQGTTYVLITLFLLQFVNWLMVLGRADLSYAQPITATSYVTVAVGSMLILGEQLPPTRWLGIVCILAGVFLISRTQQKTTGRIEDAAARVKGESK